jgi:hypothetical protein
MDNKSTTKRMIGAVVLVLIAALLLAWLLKGKNPKLQQNQLATAQQAQQTQVITGFPGVADPNSLPPAPSGPSAPPALVADAQPTQAGMMSAPAVSAPVAAPNADLQTAQTTAPDNVTTFEIRPGEARAAVDKNGNVVETAGSLGGDAITTETNTASLPDENQPAPTTAVTNLEAPANSNAQTVAAAQQTPKSLVETAQGAAVATTATTPVAANKAASTASNTDKEVLVAKPNTVATNPEAQSRAVTITAAKPAQQPRLVNEHPVPEAAAGKSAAQSAAVSKGAGETKVAKVEDKKSTGATAGVPSVNDLTASAAKRDGYVIQVLATSDRTKADTIRQNIATDGYPAFIAHGVANGKPVYRVRIGTYKAKADAISVQNRMKVRYGQNQLVQNSFVTNNN